MDKLYPRYTKPITLIAGLTAYVAFTWGLVQNGYMHASESTYAQMVVLWVVGFVALSYVPSRFETMLDRSRFLSWIDNGGTAAASEGR